MLVIGGGYIGLEMGSVWSRLGTKVTVVEKLDRIVPTMDGEIAAEFMKSLEKQGLEFKLSHKVVATKTGSKDVEATMESEKDKKQVISFETNTKDIFLLDKDHPINVKTNPKTGEPKPYVLVRSNLEGIISRNIYYKLIELAETKKVEGEQILVLKSDNQDFEIGRLGP